jgi:MoaA/NifB/PqqE/SkfB family radical SAM enzyme
MISTWKRAQLKLREAQLFAKAMASTAHPVLAQIIPTRRCNLTCNYCNEYDRISEPVPADLMLRRIDLLANLGTSIITFSGGEPMLHPELDRLIRHVRDRGAMVTLITNGYFLVPERIQRLNAAGLDYLQISIDNVQPDEVSKKSLKVLDRKLEWLAEHADFAVTINSVLGSGVRRPADALEIARRAKGLGFHSTVGLIHDGCGQAIQLDEEQRAALRAIQELNDSVYNFTHHDRFQTNIAAGRAAPWHCPAGGRFLYICEDGRVHYCSQRRGVPGIPLEEYTVQHLVQEGAREKFCAPFCTISCVRQTAMLDEVRKDPGEMFEDLVRRRQSTHPGFRPPLFLKAIAWLLVEQPYGTQLRRWAARRLNGKRPVTPQAALQSESDRS